MNTNSLLIMNDEIKFKRIVGQKGDSLSVTLPVPLLEFLGIKESDVLFLGASTGKYGKYIWVQKEKGLIDESTGEIYKED